MKEFASPHSLTDLREIKARYESELLAKANVVAVGIGLPMHDGAPHGEPGIIVSVTHKVRARELAPEDLIPRNLEGVSVWVEEIGHPQATQPSHKATQ